MLSLFFLFGAWGGVTEIPFGSSDTDRYWETLTIMIFVATADLNKKYLVPEAINSQRISQHHPKIPFLYHRRSGLFAWIFPRVWFNEKKKAIFYYRFQYQKVQVFVDLRILGCFRKLGYPQIIHFDRGFQYKPSILAYHYFRKHPYFLAPSSKWNTF